MAKQHQQKQETLFMPTLPLSLCCWFCKRI